jgi:hypothetical protein
MEHMLRAHAPSYLPAKNQAALELLDCVSKPVTKDAGLLSYESKVSAPAEIANEIHDIVSLMIIGQLTDGVDSSGHMQRLYELLGRSVDAQIERIKRELRDNVTDMARLPHAETAYHFLTPQQQEALEPILDQALRATLDQSGDLSWRRKAFAGRLAYAWFSYSKTITGATPAVLTANHRINHTAITEGLNGGDRGGPEVVVAGVSPIPWSAAVPAAERVMALAERQPIFISSTDGASTLRMPPGPSRLASLGAAIGLLTFFGPMASWLQAAQEQTIHGLAMTDRRWEQLTGWGLLLSLAAIVAIPVAVMFLAMRFGWKLGGRQKHAIGALTVLSATNQVTAAEVLAQFGSPRFEANKNIPEWAWTAAGVGLIVLALGAVAALGRYWIRTRPINEVWQGFTGRLNNTTLPPEVVHSPAFQRQMRAVLRPLIKANDKNLLLR